MSYSNNKKFIICATDKNSIAKHNSRYIGIDFDGDKSIMDFAIFYTVDGYLDRFCTYDNYNDAKVDLELFMSKYKGTGNRRYNSLMDFRIKDIIIKGRL